jgi:hypothetical protein
MKLSEIARYWAAKELTSIIANDEAIQIRAPYACPTFTLETTDVRPRRPVVVTDAGQTPLRQCARKVDLAAGMFHREGGTTMLCFDLSKGRSRIEWRGE